MNSRSKYLNAIVGLLLFAFVATSAYWLVFYFSGDVQVRDDPIYLAFESSFPMADAWMAICALVGAIGLLRRRSWGFLFGLLAASSAIFLGLVDVLFNLNEGIYNIGGVETGIEIAINVITLGLGPVVILYLWRNRSEWVC